jgi:hypothetical protein
VLRSMLRDAGIKLDDPAAEDVPRAWEVFKAFGKIPVDDVAPDSDSDGLLVQYGVYDWGDEDGLHFSFDFTRQFAFNDDEGKYDHMEQLSCNFIFEPDRELQGVAGNNLWSFEYALDEFYSRAEALDGFRQVIALRCKPRRLRVEIGAV